MRESSISHMQASGLHLLAPGNSGLNINLGVVGRQRVLTLPIEYLFY